jgi:hypothetical protein
MTCPETDKPYHYWKLAEAVRVLAATDAPLRQRILSALLSFPAVRESDLSPGLRPTFLELKAQVTWKVDGDPREGSWSNTLNAMSDNDAAGVARLIVKLFELSVEEGPPLGPDEL